MAQSEDVDDGLEPVHDPGDDDYNEKQRLREIWDARSRVQEYREELALNIGEQIPRDRAERIYHRALKQYLITIHTVFLDVYKDHGGVTVWRDIDLGEQTVDPPERLATHIDPKVETFAGLQSIVQTPAVRTVEFETEIKQRHAGAVTVSESVEVTVPWHILDSALMYANAFLSRVGFEVRAGGGGLPRIRGFNPAEGEKGTVDNYDPGGAPDL